MAVITKYDMKISNEEYCSYLKTLTNKIYKLLPLKEEGLDWEKHLDTIMIEISGFGSLIGAQPSLISLLAKLESLNSTKDFMSYRKTIFECLNEVEALYVK